MKKIIYYLSALFIIAFFMQCSEKETDDPVDENSVPTEQEISPSAKTLYSVSVVGHQEVYSEIDTTTKQVFLFIPYKSDLTVDKMQLSVNIPGNASSNIDYTKEYDLTEPINLVITAQDSSSFTYTISAKKCDINKCAIVLSDTQKDIIPLYRQASFFTNVNSVLRKANNAHVDIYYIMLKSLKNTDRWDLPDQLQYQEGTIVDKDDIFDAFEVESFCNELYKKGIGTVYVMGVSSMGCVKGTCEGAINKKFNLYLVSDAHSEPIGYREESAIDECNEIFSNNNETIMILANDVQF